MENKELEYLMSKFEEFQFEDFIDIEPESLNSCEYERGFNMGIGLCLTVLDELRK